MQIWSSLEQLESAASSQLKMIYDRAMKVEAVKSGFPVPSPLQEEQLRKDPNDATKYKAWLFDAFKKNGEYGLPDALK